MEEMDFEEWFDKFTEYARQWGYHGPIDKDSFVDDYDQGKPPLEAAIEFAVEMNG